MPIANGSDAASQNGFPLTSGHHHNGVQAQEDELIQDKITKSLSEPQGEFLGSIDGGLMLLTAELSTLYSPAVDAKIWAVASKALSMIEPPSLFPEYTKSNGKDYVFRDPEFWTSGFFPGTLYQLLYRARVSPGRPSVKIAQRPHSLKLEFACKWWTERLHSNAAMTTTHDLGFMISPWARPAWELSHDARAFETLNFAAKSLLSRFSPSVGLIRSWDTCVTTRYSFQNPSTEFLTVIDNMMNLDMLFYIASQTKDQLMWDAAVQHAKTTQSSHIRPDHSTTHLIVFDPVTGAVQQRLTNQGYSDESCWTRGQAWAIAGFAETYGWTRAVTFLDTARHCADYFVSRLPESYIPPWDFDAAIYDDEPQPPDTSAAMIASYGLLLIYKALIELGDLSEAREYLVAALRITSAVCCSHTDLTAHMSKSSSPVETVEEGISQQTFEAVCNGGGDTILTGATINNYKFAPRRWADHGLVYADYYFVLVGNLLLDLGIGRNIVQAR